MVLHFGMCFIYCSIGSALLFPFGIPIGIPSSCLISVFLLLFLLVFLLVISIGIPIMLLLFVVCLALPGSCAARGVGRMDSGSEARWSAASSMGVAVYLMRGLRMACGGHALHACARTPVQACNAMQCLLCSVAQCSAVQCGAGQRSAAQRCAVQCNAAWRSAPQRSERAWQEARCKNKGKRRGAIRKMQHERAKGRARDKKRHRQTQTQTHRHQARTHTHTHTHAP